jgi:hypothetical protein
MESVIRNSVLGELRVVNGARWFGYGSDVLLSKAETNRMKEATARIKINKLLESAGWRFFRRRQCPAHICLALNVIGDACTVRSKSQFADLSRTCVSPLFRCLTLMSTASPTGEKQLLEVLATGAR